VVATNSQSCLTESVALLAVITKANKQQQCILRSSQASTKTSQSAQSSGSDVAAHSSYLNLLTCEKATLANALLKDHNCSFPYC